MGQLCCSAQKTTTSTDRKNIVIFLSSVRPYRMADRVGKYVKDRVEAAGMNPVMIDPLELSFGIIETPFHINSGNAYSPPEWLKDAYAKVATADAYIIVCAEYNNSIPPALLLILNNFSPSTYDNRPCGIITYSTGGFGGIHAQTLLPIVVSEIWMIPVPTRVAISTVQDTFTEDGKCNEKKVANNIDTLIEEVGWYADAIYVQKKLRPFDQPSS